MKIKILFFEIVEAVSYLHVGDKLRLTRRRNVKGIILRSNKFLDIFDKFQIIFSIFLNRR